MGEHQNLMKFLKIAWKLGQRIINKQEDSASIFEKFVTI
mgnify:CR=1 FL=1